MRIKTITGILVLIVFAVINVERAFSQDDQMLEKMAADEELQQEMKWLRAETYVITASKVMETIKKAPASITVITDRQIRQMGARHLVDVLRAVPGFAPYKEYLGNYLFRVRGAASGSSNTVLLMINSHPINSSGDGGASWVYDTLIVDNVKRMEFIRGPGSSLYGANAFYGVINVITKEAEDIDGVELTAQGGSWDTQQYNLLYGKTFSDLEVAFNFNYFKTHGFRGLIEEDRQTQIDQIWSDAGIPSNFSLAPGRNDGNDEKYDVALNLKYKGFTFDGRYVDRERDLSVGGNAALNNGSINNSEDYYLTLSYETSIRNGLDFSGKVYRNFRESSGDSQLLPPSFIATYPTGYDFMPDGWKTESSGKSSRTGLEIQTTYKTNDSNTIVAGANYEDQKSYGHSMKANFSPSPDPNRFFKLPSVQEWPNVLTQDSEKKNFKAVFFEDIWDITDDLRLTTGVRYDHYSDFGSEISPRVGLTWEYINGYDLKLLYGHAFRAPTFFELSNTASDKRDLDPVVIDTYEVSLGADFTPSLNGRITFYHKETEDLILPNLSAAPWNYVNLGNARDQGLEVETKYDFGRGTYLAAFYEYRSVKSGLGDSNYNAYLMANIRLNRYLNFNADFNHWDGIDRPSGDPRDDPSSVTLVNATLIAKKFFKGFEGLELRGSVYNLFDKDWSQPTPIEIPNDWPIPGINYLLEIKFSF